MKSNRKLVMISFMLTMIFLIGSTSLVKSQVTVSGSTFVANGIKFDASESLNLLQSNSVDNSGMVVDYPLYTATVKYASAYEELLQVGEKDPKDIEFPISDSSVPIGELTESNINIQPGVSEDVYTTSDDGTIWVNGVPTASSFNTGTGIYNYYVGTTAGDTDNGIEFGSHLPSEPNVATYRAINVISDDAMLKLATANETSHASSDTGSFKNKITIFSDPISTYQPDLYTTSTWMEGTHTYTHNWQLSNNYYLASADRNSGLYDINEQQVGAYNPFIDLGTTATSVSLANTDALPFISDRVLDDTAREIKVDDQDAKFMLFAIDMPNIQEFLRNSQVLDPFVKDIEKQIGVTDDSDVIFYSDATEMSVNSTRDAYAFFDDIKIKINLNPSYTRSLLSAVGMMWGERAYYQVGPSDENNTVSMHEAFQYRFIFDELLKFKSGTETTGVSEFTLNLNSLYDQIKDQTTSQSMFVQGFKLLFFGPTTGPVDSVSKLLTVQNAVIVGGTVALVGVVSFGIIKLRKK